MRVFPETFTFGKGRKCLDYNIHSGMRAFFTLLILLIAFSGYASKKKDKVPGIVISHVDSDLRINIGSPSIVKLPDGTYLASHDIFGQVENPDKRRTHIYKSTNPRQPGLDFPVQ